MSMVIRKGTDVSSGGFNSLLLRAVDTGLVGTLGESAAKAVKFYIDVSAITKEPDDFKAQLDNLFSGSGAGSKLIEGRIRKALAEEMSEVRSISVSQQSAESQSLSQFIENCKRQYIIL